MKKQTIKLNESQLRGIIKESISEVLKEKWPEAANKRETFGYASGFEFPNGEVNPAEERERKYYEQLVRQFDKEFGKGAFEKAEKVRSKLMSVLDPTGKLFKLLASNSVNALNDWYIDREDSPYARSKFNNGRRAAGKIRKQWQDAWDKEDLK